MEDLTEFKPVNKVMGYCKCSGVSGTVQRINGTTLGECDGKGTVKCWADQDPCGASVYDFFDCPSFLRPQEYERAQA